MVGTVAMLDPLRGERAKQTPPERPEGRRQAGECTYSASSRASNSSKLFSERISPSIAKAWRSALPTPACTVGGATFTNRLDEACSMASCLGFILLTGGRTPGHRHGCNRCASRMELIWD